VWYKAVGVGHGGGLFLREVGRMRMGVFQLFFMQSEGLVDAKWALDKKKLENKAEVCCLMFNGSDLVFKSLGFGERES
jgi:hypothetical protein